MAATPSNLVPLGTPLPAFVLADVDGAQVKSSDFTGDALLVAFLSNHCPFVKHIEAGLAALTSEYAERGLSVAAISSNDTGLKPEDDVDGLKAQIERTGFQFPYLLDPTQQVAKDFQAACTPDFFLYGRDRALVYRGALDGARPGNGVPVTGDLLRGAIELALKGEPVPEPHTPSLGCNIKWAPGNEPAPVTYG